MNLNTTTRKIQRLIGARADGIYGPETAGKILATLTSESVDPDTGQGFDARTERNLATLQPGARRKFEPFVRRAIAVASSMGVTAKVICGERDRAAQEAAKRSGASRASYGYSWHNFGMAIDFGLFKGRSYVDADSPALAEAVYNAIGAVAPQYGILWGGTWRSFVDMPHFQVPARSTPNAAERRRLVAGTYSS